MRACPACRAKIPRGAAVCGSCGARLPIEPPRAGILLGRFERFAVPILLDLLADRGIEASTFTHMAGPYPVEGVELRGLVEIYVLPERLDEARRLVAWELPARLRDVESSIARDAAFAETEQDEEPAALAAFGWLEHDVARVLLEELADAGIAGASEYPLDEPPPAYARPDGRVRVWVEELFLEEAGEILGGDVRRRLREEGIPHRDPLRVTDDP